MADASERSAAILRRIAAEVRGELTSIARTAAETEALLLRISQDRITLYAAAALLDTFYTGIEKCFRRIAGELGGVPEGSGWHRTLLDDMALEIPKLRSPVLSAETVRLLSRFLSFRHRFRNLYLFDLDPEPIVALIEGLPRVWASARAELEALAAWLEKLADELG